MPIYAQIMPPPMPIPRLPEKKPLDSVELGDPAQFPEVKLDFPIAQGLYQPTWSSIAQNYPGQEVAWLREAKVGFWVHFGPQASGQSGDWYARRMYIPGQKVYDNHIRDFGHPSQVGYKELLHNWNPKKLNPAALVKTYHDAGARFLLIQGVHHDNFDNWNSTYQPWVISTMTNFWITTLLEMNPLTALLFGVSAAFSASALAAPEMAAPNMTAPFATGPLTSPLTPAKQDAIGKQLQNSLIWAPPEAVLSSPFVAFRQKFVLGARPRAARLHLFADVRYLLWINGQYAASGPARFEPGGPEYDSIDVARYLRSGDNQIAVVVLSNVSNGKMRRHAPGLAARLDADGKTALVTDGNWKWSDQTRYRRPAVSWADVKDRIDARVEDGDWTQATYNDSQWRASARVNGQMWGPFSARRTPLLRETPVPLQIEGGRTFPITLQAGEKLVFTTARMVQAFTTLDIDAEAGSEVTLEHAQVEYIAKSGRQTYVSSDTRGIFGGTLSVKSGRVTIHDFRLTERLYPFEVVGSFQSNDETLNRLWALCARSAQIMSEDAYVDCADRERVEWMDCDPPAFDITRTALAGVEPDGKRIYADARLLGAMLRRTALTVQPGGWVKAHTASDRFDIHANMEDRSCDWVEGARRYYESTQDKTLIREIWPVIVSQMNYLLARRTPRGLVLAREWEVWGNPIGYIECEGAGLNAFVYKALVDAAYLGEIIGEKQQSASFSADAKALATAFNTVLWDEKNGTYFSGYGADETQIREQFAKRKVTVPFQNNLIAATMFPALFALDQGIVPASRRERVINYLFAHRAEAKRIMTFYYLFGQMYRADTPQFDQEILDTTRQKWEPMLQWPWQTSWEEFECGSKAHIYGMFPGYFLSAYVLGVRRDGPVWNKRVLIEPRLGDLTRAEGTVVSEFGPVAVFWQKEGEKLLFRIEIPAGVEATLHIPQNGVQSHLILNGKKGVGTLQGRYFVVPVGAGSYQGNVGTE